jgi:hypothetical protein
MLHLCWSYLLFFTWVIVNYPWVIYPIKHSKEEYPNGNKDDNPYMYWSSSCKERLWMQGRIRSCVVNQQLDESPFIQILAQPLDQKKDINIYQTIVNSFAHWSAEYSSQHLRKKVKKTHRSETKRKEWGNQKYTFGLMVLQSSFWTFGNNKCNIKNKKK